MESPADRRLRRRLIKSRNPNPATAFNDKYFQGSYTLREVLPGDLAAYRLSWVKSGQHCTVNQPTTSLHSSYEEHNWPKPP